MCECSYCAKGQPAFCVADIPAVPQDGPCPVCEADLAAQEAANPQEFDGGWR